MVVLYCLRIMLNVFSFTIFFVLIPSFVQTHCLLGYKYSKICYFYDYNDECFSETKNDCKIFKVSQNEERCPYFYCSKADADISSKVSPVPRNSSKSRLENSTDKRDSPRDEAKLQNQPISEERKGSGEDQQSLAPPLPSLNCLEEKRFEVFVNKTIEQFSKQEKFLTQSFEHLKNNTFLSDVLADKKLNSILKNNWLVLKNISDSFARACELKILSAVQNESDDLKKIKRVEKNINEKLDIFQSSVLEIQESLRQSQISLRNRSSSYLLTRMATVQCEFEVCTLEFHHRDVCVIRVPTNSSNCQVPCSFVGMIKLTAIFATVTPQPYNEDSIRDVASIGWTKKCKEEILFDSECPIWFCDPKASTLSPATTTVMPEFPTEFYVGIIVSLCFALSVLGALSVFLVKKLLKRNERMPIQRIEMSPLLANERHFYGDDDFETPRPNAPSLSTFRPIIKAHAGIAVRPSDQSVSYRSHPLEPRSVEDENEQSTSFTNIPLKN